MVKSLKKITSPPPQTEEQKMPNLEQIEEEVAWNPPPLASLEDTGLSRLNVSDLILKVLYNSGDMYGHEIAARVKLPFTAVLDGTIEWLKHEQFIDIGGGGGIGEVSYRYIITTKGVQKALEAMERTAYAGPAPVPLDEYIASTHRQNVRQLSVNREDMMQVTEKLIVSADMLDKLGPAVNSGTSIFLYGPPGNGKTTLSEAVGRFILGDDMWIPYSVDVDGQVIQIFDDINHELSEDQSPVKYGTGTMADPRWIRVKRPMIMVGGELEMESLDLIYDPVSKFYEAPYQVKATGGLFLIDDFGRQQVSPLELLNRWIVPLEKKIDFLTLNNGRKIGLPFRLLIVFSTNLDPSDLVDDAFLRRIKYKIEVGNPTMDQFRELFELMCRIMKVPFDERGLAYLIREWYQKYDRDLRFVHPRDILSQLLDASSYLGVEPRMTKDLLDRAAESYFVEL
jgi:predicted ATPase with chaperone activity